MQLFQILQMKFANLIVLINFKIYFCPGGLEDANTVKIFSNMKFASINYIISIELRVNLSRRHVFIIHVICLL